MMLHASPRQITAAPTLLTLNHSRHLAAAELCGGSGQQEDHSRSKGRRHHLLRSSRSLRNTVFGSGLSGRSGKASRKRLITDRLVSLKKVLISLSNAKVVTRALVVSCLSIAGSISLALALSGSRSRVKPKLRAM